MSENYRFLCSMFDTKSDDNFLPFAVDDDFDLKRSKFRGSKVDLQRSLLKSLGSKVAIIKLLLARSRFSQICLWKSTQIYCGFHLHLAVNCMHCALKKTQWREKNLPNRSTSSVMFYVTHFTCISLMNHFL